MTPVVQPLSYRHRNVFFYVLMGVFISALPFLFLYASGYRFYFGDRALVSTGGLYIAADRNQAEIYINDELVRETRVFRRAFYAQGLEAKTHKVHVQKEGHHTWVKELPVYAHLVTEAQAFNLPLQPTVRIITPYVTAAGVATLTATSSVLENVEVENQLLIERRAATTTLATNSEYADLTRYFASSTVTGNGTVPAYVSSVVQNTPDGSPSESATSTKEFNGVRLFEVDGKIFARYAGDTNSMPYYYCALEFPRYSKATTTARHSLTNVAEAKEIFENDLMLEVQTVTEPTGCDPVIEIDHNNEQVSYFDFFPGSSDLVIVGTTSGIYVVEIDDRAWQNRQTLLAGSGLDVRVINGSIYVADKNAIYQVRTDDGWF